MTCDDDKNSCEANFAKPERETSFWGMKKQIRDIIYRIVDYLTMALLNLEDGNNIARESSV